MKNEVKKGSWTRRLGALLVLVVDTLMLFGAVAAAAFVGVGVALVEIQRHPVLGASLGLISAVTVFFAGYVGKQTAVLQLAEFLGLISFGPPDES